MILKCIFLGILWTTFTQAQVPSICRMPKAPGICRAAFTRFYFDTSTKTCKQFIYGGCAGNGNNFPNKQHCEGVCRVNTGTFAATGASNSGTFAASGFSNSGGTFAASGVSDTGETFAVSGPITGRDPCRQNKSPGACRGNFHRFYYDQRSRTCRTFIFGGCGGNQNNFLSQRQCEEKCNVVIDDLNICNKARSRGPCNGRFTRFYYDQNTKTCAQFTYGGCLGNQNNFVSRRQCQQQCGNNSELPPLSISTNGNAGIKTCDQLFDVGPCKGAMTRFYYDSATRSCQPFFYGGCLGNKNNFLRKQDCENFCMKNQGLTITKRKRRTRG